MYYHRSDWFLDGQKCSEDDMEGQMLRTIDVTFHTVKFCPQEPLQYGNCPTGRC